MRNFGRTFRTILILAVVIIVLTVVVGQVLKNVVNYEDTANVLVYSYDVPKGEQFKDGDENNFVRTIKIPRSEIPPTALTSADGVAGLYINEDVFKGEFVTKNTLSETYPYHVSYDIPKGYSLVSVKFDRGDSANAWNVFEGQEVKLVYTPSTTVVTAGSNDYLVEKLLNGTVYSIKDSQYFVQGEVEFNPTKLLYITFLVKENDAIFISRIKDKGRIDIIQ